MMDILLETEIQAPMRTLNLTKNAMGIENLTVTKQQQKSLSEI